MKKITPILPASIFLATLLFSANFCFAEDYLTEKSAKMAVEYRDKGLKAQKRGDFDTALIYYQKAMELDPSLALAYNDAGIMYEAKGWNDRAKQAYAKAIELDPTMLSPYYNLGVIYEREGDLDRAIYYFKKRVVIGDWNDEWTMKARQELRSLGVSDPELKADFLDKHLASIDGLNDPIKGTPKGHDLDPKKRKRDARFHLFRAKQLYYMGMYQDALRELGTAEILDPKNKEIQKTLEEVNRKILLIR